MVNNQLLNAVQVDHLAIAATKSDAVDMLGFDSVSFLANFSSTSGTITLKVQESATTTDGDFTDLIVSYYKDGVVTAGTAGSSVLQLSTTAAAGTANKFFAISVNRPGKDSSVPSVTSALSSKRYLRVVVSSGATTYVVALKHNADLAPVAQPDFILPELKGTN